MLESTTESTGKDTCTGHRREIPKRNMQDSIVLVLLVVLAGCAYAIVGNELKDEESASQNIASESVPSQTIATPSSVTESPVPRRVESYSSMRVTLI